ncbi:MAG: zinc-binding dehydrogenase [Capsulimonadaceae bacterium]
MKLRWAWQFCATHTINAAHGDPVAKVREIPDGVGVDYAYEAVGISRTIEQAVASLAYAGTQTH